jgi:hypothetical protein
MNLRLTQIMNRVLDGMEGKLTSQRPRRLANALRTLRCGTSPTCYREACWRIESGGRNTA